jgi:hypothetical protein
MTLGVTMTCTNKGSHSPINFLLLAKYECGIGRQFLQSTENGVNLCVCTNFFGYYLTYFPIEYAIWLTEFIVNVDIYALLPAVPCWRHHSVLHHYGIGEILEWLKKIESSIPRNRAVQIKKVPKEYQEVGCANHLVGGTLETTPIMDYQIGDLQPRWELITLPLDILHITRTL